MWIQVQENMPKLYHLSGALPETKSLQYLSKLFLLGVSSERSLVGLLQSKLRLALTRSYAKSTSFAASRGRDKVAEGSPARHAATKVLACSPIPQRCGT